MRRWNTSSVFISFCKILAFQNGKQDCLGENEGGERDDTVAFKAHRHRSTSHSRKKKRKGGKLDDEAGKHVLLPRKTKESLGDENMFVRARMSDSPWEKHLPPFSSFRDSPTDGFGIIA